MKTSTLLTTVLLTVLSNSAAMAYQQSACEEKAYAEMREMSASPYWKAQKQKLVTVLSGMQLRGCGQMSNAPETKASIFADDSEFLSETLKYEQSGLGFATVNRYGQETGVSMYVSTTEGAPQTVVVRLDTKDAVITKIQATVGSDAQCSPKVLLANLIANAPDSLKIGCGYNRDEVNSSGSIQKRLQTEKVIVSGGR